MTLSPTSHIHTLPLDPSTTLRVEFTYLPPTPDTRLDPGNPEEIELVSLQVFQAGRMTHGAEGVEILGLLDLLGEEATEKVLSWCVEWAEADLAASQREDEDDRAFIEAWEKAFPEEYLPGSM